MEVAPYWLYLAVRTKLQMQCFSGNSRRLSYTFGESAEVVSLSWFALEGQFWISLDAFVLVELQAEQHTNDSARHSTSGSIFIQRGPTFENLACFILCRNLFQLCLSCQKISIPDLEPRLMARRRKTCSPKPLAFRSARTASTKTEARTVFVMAACAR